MPNQWISVKDRLPQVGEKILIFCPGTKQKMFLEEYIGPFSKSVTHWKPWIEPPPPPDPFETWWESFSEAKRHGAALRLIGSTYVEKDEALSIWRAAVASIKKG
jgi:hypothetical protein